MTNGFHGSKRALALFGIVVFSVLSGVSSFRQNGSRSDQAFPDSEGTYWIYRGIVRWTRQNSNKVGQAPVTWKMQLEKVIRRSNLTAFVLNGFPDGLDWSDGTARPTDSLIIQTADGRLYRIESQTVAAALKSLDNPDKNVAGLLKDDDLFLKLPLYRGAKFCDAESMARDDGMYCWFVRASRSINFTSVKGLPPGRRKVYEVQYATNPDTEAFEFSPGLGMTRYEYHHHGTVADTELTLTQFHLGGAK